MCLKSSAVNAVGIIENAMQMRMLLVDMTSHEILIFTFEELLTYLLSDLQGSFGSDLPRLKADYKVLCKDGAFARTVFPYFCKIMTCLQRIRAAPVCDNEPAVVGLVGVGDIVQ